ncbi:MAG TPA: V-type ATP synthase subunit E [Candidatus Aphodoplasma excrementigallinarum]|uniref:V-type proton ATPase subunit E n=1 Tax=Candidatus Aphodoplasma excrementigallinarum TaxID=2840673 RepID=A0A9D1T044_9FIRM|nr:V-type ATP synthase subunit E [Candidatus Aphodoplasma excrementigallinarum]
MGAEKIIEKIIADAEEKAREITSGAQAEAGRIVAAANEAAAEKKEKSLAEGEKEAALTKQRIVSSAHMEAKKLLLQARQDLLSEAFAAALNKIQNMDNAQFERLMTDLMVNLIETGDETVIINEADKKRLSPDFLYYVNRTVAKEQVPCNVTMSDEARDIPSGFILKRGDVEINATFEALLRQKKDALSAEVVKILF